MIDEVFLRLTGKQHLTLKRHLFPGDGKEAVAFLLCGRHAGRGRYCLSVAEVFRIEHQKCVRSEDRVTWPTDDLPVLFERAAAKGLSVLKIHSHPNGLAEFSDHDDKSDEQFFASANSWIEDRGPNGSVVMLPDGKMFGRYATDPGRSHPISMISVAGDNLLYLTAEDEEDEFVPDFADRHAQVLGKGTFAKLRKLRIAVVGCSGTGSPVVEQLFRLGVGELVLVDPDTIGPENLNRIINSRGHHATSGYPKVKLLADAIEETGLGTHVVPVQLDLCNPSVVREVASCDLVFGCVDSVFGRHILNKIASTYCLPYIDVGVGIRADTHGGISQATGAVHYLQPDGSSLTSRGVFSMADVQADSLARSDPDEYAGQREEGYIRGADVGQPAVISINSLFASYAVLEMLQRLHQIRNEDNAKFSVQRWSLSGCFEQSEVDGSRCPSVSRNLGRGDMIPLLGLPELSETTTSEQANV